MANETMIYHFYLLIMWHFFLIKKLQNAKLGEDVKLGFDFFP